LADVEQYLKDMSQCY